jgi:hydrogenase expression/formation protein HypE
MHDPTEGGVRMGVCELALASGKSVELLEDVVPVRMETKRICAKYELDPLGLLGSGALLATFKLVDAEKYIMALRRDGVPATVIGRVIPGRNKSLSIKGNQSAPLSSSERDEVLKVLGP